jgi:hypothetical protein
MTRLSLVVAAGIALVLAADPAVGQNQGARPANSLSAQAATARITYNPPDRQAPGGRIGASTRSTMYRDLNIEVLAPDDHVGWSAAAQPVLYYYLSRLVNLPLEVTIDTHELGRQREPLLEMTQTLDRPAGIHAINLRDFGIRLTPQVVYRWSVAIIVNPDQRSSDLIASGLIMHVPPPANFANAVARQQDDVLMRSYAEHGYWYDAIKAVSQAADRRPDLRQQRADLLDQVSLADAAAFDRLGGPK